MPVRPGHPFPLGEFFFLGGFDGFERDDQFMCGTERKGWGETKGYPVQKRRVSGPFQCRGVIAGARRVSPTRRITSSPWPRGRRPLLALAHRRASLSLGSMSGLDGDGRS